MSPLIIMVTDRLSLDDLPFFSMFSPITILFDTTIMRHDLPQNLQRAKKRHDIALHS